MTEEQLKNVLEAALLAAERPLNVDQLLVLFEGGDRPPDRQQVRRALGALAEGCAGRGIELAEVAGGFRFQVIEAYAGWVARLGAERPPRYSRALLETLALIAYRQPITRGEIEDVRGVGVSSSIMKTLLEREWVRVLGHREVPGRPEMLGTTRRFLDDFGLKALDDLPPLTEIRELESLGSDLFAEAERRSLEAHRANPARESGVRPPEGPDPGPDPAG